MNPLSPPLRDQRKIDAGHLKLLSIFHFIMAGCSVLGLAFLFFHYQLTRQSLVHDGALRQPSADAASLAWFLSFSKWFYFVLGGIDILCAVGNLLSGFYIRERKHRTFSLIVAGLNCLRMSIGTVLGIFTFIVLLRNSVREAYDFPAGTAPLPTPGAPEPPQPSNPMSLIRPQEGPPILSAPPPVAASQGDATGGIIPYKNPPALVAYYLGVFSVIPVIGFIFAVAAVWLGIVGLRRRKLQPVIRGTVHAWFGIIAGLISIAVHLWLSLLIARFANR